MKIKSKLFLLLLILTVLFSTSACSLTKGGDSAAVAAYKPVKLVYWSVWNNEAVMRDIIAAYKKARPNVTIEYRNLRYDEYEQAILEADAQGRGPDVFSIHNTWMQKYAPRLLSAPATYQIPIKTMQGTLKKEEVVIFQSNKGITPYQVDQKFLQQVKSDAVVDNKVYGLPMSLDTLVLFCNRDLMRNAGITEPPKDWLEFEEQVKKITKIDANTGKILVSGTAMGTSNNIPRSFDILSLLMMQNSTQMLNSKGQAYFDSMPENLKLTVVPGRGALDFYTQFSSPLYQGYSWNTQMPDALEAFKDGKVAYFFGYSYNRDNIKLTAPKLNFIIAPAPQVNDDKKVNYASYWLEVVSNKTKNKDYAWDFVQFMTSEANVEAYLNKAVKPTALNSTKLINKQLDNPDLAVFAEQLFTAKSWYNGKNSSAAEAAFAQMITDVLAGNLDAEKALKQAADKVDRSIK